MKAPTINLQCDKHNLNDLTVHIPQQRCLSEWGFSSGKSTLLSNVIYQNLLEQRPHRRRARFNQRHRVYFATL